MAIYLKKWSVANSIARTNAHYSVRIFCILKRCFQWEKVLSTELDNSRSKVVNTAGFNKRLAKHLYHSHNMLSHRN